MSGRWFNAGANVKDGGPALKQHPFKKTPHDSCFIDFLRQNLFAEAILFTLKHLNNSDNAREC